VVRQACEGDWRFIRTMMGQTGQALRRRLTLLDSDSPLYVSAPLTGPFEAHVVIDSVPPSIMYRYHHVAHAL